MPVTPTPTRWRSGNMIQPEYNEGSMESAGMDENKGQERWQTGGSSRAPSRASEARSGIRQQKILVTKVIDSQAKASHFPARREQTSSGVGGDPGNAYASPLIPVLTSVNQSLIDLAVSPLSLLNAWFMYSEAVG